MHIGIVGIQRRVIGILHISQVILCQLKVYPLWWQVIASCISIVLIIIFTCKGASNLSKAKKAKKATENRYKAYCYLRLIGCILPGCLPHLLSRILFRLSVQKRKA